jgi:hypothetical protein
MSAVRPILTEHDLGATGWRVLHQLARQRRRTARDQALQLVRYALYHAIAGDDVELTQSRLEGLLGRQLEPAVA